jgi:hypothetical protein
MPAASHSLAQFPSVAVRTRGFSFWFLERGLLSNDPVEPPSVFVAIDAKGFRKLELLPLPTARQTSPIAESASSTPRRSPALEFKHQYL